MHNRRLLLGIAIVLSAAGALALAASPASAVIYVDGDWNVNGVESYADETIIVNDTTGSNGNLIIGTLGNLTLNNCTLILPFNRTLDQGGILRATSTRFDGPNWFFFIHGPSHFTHVIIHNATHRSSGGFSGTYISESDVRFDNVTWSRTSPRSNDYRTSIIHIRVVMDFKNVRLTQGSEVYYELSPIANSADIDVSNITFVSSTSMGYRTSFFTVTAVTHPGTVIYNIHDINITDANDGIDLRAASPSTLYNIYNISVQGHQSTAIEVGDGGNSRFGGQIAVTNVTVVTAGGFGGGTRAFRIFGTQGADILVSQLRVTGGGRAVVADGCPVTVEDSNLANTGFQFYADNNAKITVYRTVDNPALTTATGGANSSVEHMAFLNIVAVNWQGGVPFQGDILFLRNATGGGNLNIDPATWTPRFTVWWGRYSGLGLFDNRDLRPLVVDGSRTFNCSPSQFFFTESMGALSITCNDNWGPTAFANHPRAALVVNQSTFNATGLALDYGSGLGTLSWSFDNLTWNSITIPASGQNWSAPLTAIAEGPHDFYVRAIDRVGQAFYLTVGRFLVDTSPPIFTMPPPPEFVGGFNFTLSGGAEPQARLSYTSTSGLTGNTTVDSTAQFTLVLPLTEGLNVFTITAVDLAGNVVTQTYSLVADHTPPALTVLLDPVTYTASQTLFVGGLSEATATVSVNGMVAPRTGDEFLLGVTLATGPTNIAVRATDLAGNVREWFGLAVFDNAVPDLSVVVSTGNTTSTGAHITGKVTVPVAGQVTDGLTSVESLSINGVEYVFDSEGVFFVALNVTEGLNSFAVMARDLVGNTAYSNFSVLRDSTPPTATVALATSTGAPIIDIGGVPYTNETSLTLIVTMSEAGTVTLNGQARPAVAGENSYYVTIVNGDNEFRFIFKDIAGNKGIDKTVIVVRDTLAPAVSLTSPANGAILIGDSFTVEGTAEVGSTVTINGETVPVSPTGTFSKTLPLVDGSNPVNVVATDALGNRGEQSVAVTRGQEEVPLPPPQSDFTMSILFLAVGIGAGVGIGFVVKARGGKAMRQELAEAEQGSATPQVQTTGYPQQPPRGPPRGPQQPPGY